MSEKYDYTQHTHVLVNHPKCPIPGFAHEKSPDEPYWVDDAWRGTFEIALFVGTHVWITSSYAAEGHPDVVRVGKKYGPNGECILAVPTAWCRFYTPAEAEGIEMCIDADDRLLSYM